MKNNAQFLHNVLWNGRVCHQGDSQRENTTHKHQGVLRAFYNKRCYLYYKRLHMPGPLTAFPESYFNNMKCH